MRRLLALVVSASLLGGSAAPAAAQHRAAAVLVAPVQGGSAGAAALAGARLDPVGLPAPAAASRVLSISAAPAAAAARADRRLSLTRLAHGIAASLGSLREVSAVAAPAAEPLQRPSAGLAPAGARGASRPGPVADEAAAEAYSREIDRLPPIGRGFVEQAKANWNKLAMTDSATGKRIPYGRALVGTVLLGWTLQKMLPPNKNVGVLIPPTAGGAITNLAITQIGKVPVNLSFVGTPEQMQAAIRKGEIGTVIAARGLVEKFKIPVTPEMVFIEDVMPKVLSRKIASALLYVAARALPAGLLSRLFMPKAPKSLSDTATILFTTGSSGDPKGVELTHKNLVANIESIRRVFPIQGDDRILGSLPLFHAFGLTATIGLPFTSGFGAVYHTNPKEVEKIAGLIDDNDATFLVTIPSLLPDFTAKVDAARLRSLRYVIVGAEKLEPAVQKAFEDKFGVPVLEGYGATELSPVATLNLPHARKPGSAGRPLPGVAIRIVHPDDSSQVLPPGSEGRILVKGANVMKGYYRDPERTASVIKDGWYDTEDAGYLDADGFLFITDRLNRIAKIKGEKVPMKLVEQELQEAAGLTQRAFLVVNPRDSVGEKLVVVYAGYDGPIPPLLAKMKAKGLKNVMIPSPEHFMKVDALPTVGIGKADYKTVKKWAEERFGGQK
ncbi:MAG: AMP-binding protein [Elusimicrobia bacterium]|nr:AMP-binding protein [Elusimicrobiota bacterium]